MTIEKRHLIHAAEILTVFALAHHFWPKGITYGEKEAWEIAHRKRKEKAERSLSSSRGRSTTGVDRRRIIDDEMERGYGRGYGEYDRTSYDGERRVWNNKGWYDDSAEVEREVRREKGMRQRQTDYELGKEYEREQFRKENRWIGERY